MTDFTADGMSPETLAHEPTPGWRSLRVVKILAHPFAWAFVGTIGVLLALSLGSATAALSAILVTVGVALFIALALDPAVRRIEARGVERGKSVAMVCAIFTLAVGAGLAFIVPAAFGQLVGFAGAVPGYRAGLQQSAWFQSFVSTTAGSAFYESMLAQAEAWLSDPSHLLSLGAGALAVSAGVIGAVSGTIIVVVLAIYFLASMEAMKASFYELVPAYSRPKVAQLTEQISRSVGGFVGGGLTLSSLNAAFSLVLLLILGVPYALMLAMLSLVVTLLPMIGSVLFWVIASFVTLLYSPPAALAFAIVYFVYMQVEAYVITPRVMGRAVSVPGALVLIGAMVGASLLGLLGALVAVPVTASILMILRGVFIPGQNAKTSRDGPTGLPRHDGSAAGASVLQPD
jgi:predicted PurR-regulated permease PerM